MNATSFKQGRQMRWHMHNSFSDKPERERERDHQVDLGVDVWTTFKWMRIGRVVLGKGGLDEVG
jgi:hypothetical protein